MWALLIFFLIISSGSFVCAITLRKKYDEVLPITCAGIVLVLFLFSVYGALRIGAIVVVLAGIFAYAVGIALLIRKKECRENITNFVCPAFWIFCASVIVLLWCAYGKMFDSWDEFSHWGDVVKVMATMDELATSEKSFSWFKSYPPGMALFQYLAQKMNQWTTQMVFCEWLVYIVYQMFVVAFLLPVFTVNEKEKGIVCKIGPIILILFAPLMFGDGVYRYLYIDPVLGILFACGIATLVNKREITWLHILHESAICSMLVLMKDAGLLFAAILMLGVCLDVMLCGKENDWNVRIGKVAVIISSVAMPKLLWSEHLKHANVHAAFSQPYDFRDFFDVAFGRTYSYRTEVLYGFVRMLKQEAYYVGGIAIPRFAIAVAVMLGFAVFAIGTSKIKGERLCSTIVAIMTVGFTMVVYILGMLLSYMYKFSEYEAVNLASFSRYISILYEAIWLLFVTQMWFLLQTVHKKMSVIGGLVLLVVITVVVPKGNLLKGIMRESVRESVLFRSQYDELTVEIMKACSGTDNVFLISQGDTGLDLCVLKFAIRPNVMNNNPWSFGDATYEGDIYTYNCSPDMLQSMWEQDGYGYVAISKINDDFINKYQELFEVPGDIQENAVFRITEELRLKRCD